MNGKRHTPEQIIHKLRQAEVELGQGSTVPQVCKKIGGRSRPITGGARSLVGCAWIRRSG